MLTERSAGILLHPTCLPGPYGIGDLGPMACHWIDTLSAMKQTWWQILPLGPTGFGHSPYQCYSAFAGNWLLLSPERLADDKLVPSNFILPTIAEGRVEFEAVISFKAALLRAAWSMFQSGKSAVKKSEYEEYCGKESEWLDDYAFFMAVRESRGNKSLFEWPEELLFRKPAALAAAQAKLAADIQLHQFGEFLFDRQWAALREYAKSKNVQILGDLPIFISADSADVWAHPETFLLDAERRPSVAAGVPPDYFSEDGQHWGNPIYDWRAMKKDGFRWWIERVKRALTQVDLIRLDHFRGFLQAWHIPADEKTARSGKWVDGPGRTLFDALKKSLGDLPFLAEDLGLITPDVVELREVLQLPGMRVLQFMLGEPKNPYQPHNYDANTAVYTGTHDNDTTAGWFATLNEKDRGELAKYLGHEVRDPAQDLVRLAWASVAKLAVAPLQDVLSLGGEARMNVPGQPAGNWGWRVRLEQFDPKRIEWMADITERYGRTAAIAEAIS